MQGIWSDPGFLNLGLAREFEYFLWRVIGPGRVDSFPCPIDPSIGHWTGQWKGQWKGWLHQTSSIDPSIDHWTGQWKGQWKGWLLQTSPMDPSIDHWTWFGTLVFGCPEVKN